LEEKKIIVRFFLLVVEKIEHIILLKTKLRKMYHQGWI